MVNYTCPTCDKQFSKKDSFIKHTEKKKNPCRPKTLITSQTLSNPSQIPHKNSQIPHKNSQILTEEPVKNVNKINEDIQNKSCLFCGLVFNRKDNLKRHMDKFCKVKKLQNEEKETILQMLIEKDKKIDAQTKEMEEIKKQLEDVKKQIQKQKNKAQITSTHLINNQLIDIIIDKDKKLEELVNKKEENIIIEDNEIVENNQIDLVINDQVIMHRNIDKYINATQLCKAGGKKFSHWICLDSTKELIMELEKSINKSNAGIPALNVDIKSINKSNTENSALKKDIKIFESNLIDSKIGGNHVGTWIHPDLAIQLAQWISPKFALQISSWIRTLFTKGKVEMDIKIIKEQENKIKLLQDMVVKKQRRKDYPDSNVIYLLTTKANKKERIYIVGKAINLKSRLGTYNKTCEHEVIFYKSCKTKEFMEIVEKCVLTKLEKYREKANRDRFILPVDKNIDFFKNIIENCVDFFDKS